MNHLNDLIIAECMWHLELTFEKGKWKFEILSNVKNIEIETLQGLWNLFLITVTLF